MRVIRLIVDNKKLFNKSYLVCANSCHGDDFELLLQLLLYVYGGKQV